MVDIMINKVGYQRLKMASFRVLAHSNLINLIQTCLFLPLKEVSQANLITRILR